MTRGEFERDILPLNQNLYRYAFRFLLSREEAEDAVQEVFVKLWKMRSGLSKYKSVEALAMTITRNYCLDRLRRKGREIRKGNTPAVDTRTPDISPEQLFEKKETYSIIIDLINDLPEQYRTVLQLRDIDGYEYEEIADRLNLNINTLRVNLSRGRKMIREQLGKFHYGKIRT
jgi:RNA polymerase sigma-70 factor (ECF subfamily)